MTMARVKGGSVVEYGLPDRLKNEPHHRLVESGWRIVKSPPKPTPPSEGVGYVYGPPYTYDEDEDAVYGTWSEVNTKEESIEIARKSAIKERERLLNETDWTQLPDVGFPLERLEAWQTYRQALRDITEQDGFPLDIKWPEQPGDPLEGE